MSNVTYSFAWPRLYDEFPEHRKLFDRRQEIERLTVHVEAQMHRRADRNQILKLVGINLLALERERAVMRNLLRRKP